MKVSALHDVSKSVSAKALFKGEEGTSTALQLLVGETLKEHTTKVPALLMCIQGEAVFENEKGVKETLLSGDYVLIEPNVKHLVKGIETSQLVLLK